MGSDPRHGAPFMSVVLFGVLPQSVLALRALPRISSIQPPALDRPVGIVGAGGIGTLFAAFQRFDYDFVCAILLSIIGLIMVGEFVSNFVRALFTGKFVRDGLVPRRKVPAPERDRAMGAVEGS